MSHSPAPYVATCAPPTTEDTPGVRVRWAIRCFDKWGDALLCDPQIRFLQRELRTAIGACRRMATESGLAEICRVCDQQSGSCCGAGMERHCDAVLLLVNALLGADLPAHNAVKENNCFFLGPTGCKLATADVICVNYLCDRVTTQLSPQALTSIRTHDGKRLDTLFVLRSHLARRLRVLLTADDNADDGWAHAGR